MRLNTLKPGAGAKTAKKRLGRGIAAGSARPRAAAQGQHARAGGFHKVGFEAARCRCSGACRSRLPVPAQAVTGEVRLSELAKVAGDVVDMAALHEAGVLPRAIARAKLILSGTVGRAFTVRGVAATKGARAAIEQAGGKIED